MATPDWHREHLAALALVPLSEEPRGAGALRILYMPTFHAPCAITFGPHDGLELVTTTGPRAADLHIEEQRIDPGAAAGLVAAASGALAVRSPQQRDGLGVAIERSDGDRVWSHPDVEQDLPLVAQAVALARAHLVHARSRRVLADIADYLRGA